jgi:predicted O-linked N-acetylglucosamine transferase (SPINDLY family)
VPHLSAQEIAALARADKIDIAVDLMGFTRKARLEIFARRAAPVQINYLGYPGTMGADFIDYMIADKVIVPDAERAHYREKMITLPGSHMATDDKRQTASRAMARADFGLPENGFVFCCFNNSFKISADDYDVWMRLLKNVEGSVLWLVDSNIWASANLCHEAEKRGVDPKRLIAAKRVPMAEHMARHALADLFLDTAHYTGHATAADALWAGLPLVTRPGRGYHTRVSAGLLTALGMPELIASSAEEYERIALELATDPGKLAAVKAKLAERRQTSPLFDSAAFARHIEDGYRKAYARFFDGQPPEDIAVPA